MLLADRPNIGGSGGISRTPVGPDLGTVAATDTVIDRSCNEIALGLCFGPRLLSKHPYRRTAPLVEEYWDSEEEAEEAETGDGEEQAEVAELRDGEEKAEYT